MPISLNAFLVSPIWLSKSSYLLPASVVRAVFPSHALLAVCTAFSIFPLELASLNMVSDNLTSESFMSFKTAMADLPFLFVSLSPPKNFDMAPMALPLKASVNCDLLMPDTLANSASIPLFVSTAICIFLNSLLIALPPFSASMPTELSAVPSAIISGADKPISLPVDDRFVPIATISCSVVANLFPKSTTVEPSFS